MQIRFKEIFQNLKDGTLSRDDSQYLAENIDEALHFANKRLREENDRSDRTAVDRWLTSKLPARLLEIIKESSPSAFQISKTANTQSLKIESVIPASGGVAGLNHDGEEVAFWLEGLDDCLVRRPAISNLLDKTDNELILKGERQLEKKVLSGLRCKAVFKKDGYLLLDGSLLGKSTLLASGTIVSKLSEKHDGTRLVIEIKKESDGYYYRATKTPGLAIALGLAVNVAVMGVYSMGNSNGALNTPRELASVTTSIMNESDVGQMPITHYERAYIVAALTEYVNLLDGLDVSAAPGAFAQKSALDSELNELISLNYDDRGETTKGYLNNIEKLESLMSLSQKFGKSLEKSGIDDELKSTVLNRLDKSEGRVKLALDNLHDNFGKLKFIASSKGEAI